MDHWQILSQQRHALDRGNLRIKPSRQIVTGSPKLCWAHITGRCVNQIADQGLSGSNRLKTRSINPVRSFQPHGSFGFFVVFLKTVPRKQPTKCLLIQICLGNTLLKMVTPLRQFTDCVGQSKTTSFALGGRAIADQRALGITTIRWHQKGLPQSGGKL